MHVAGCVYARAHVIRGSDLLPSFSFRFAPPSTYYYYCLGSREHVRTRRAQALQRDGPYNSVHRAQLPQFY